jgi:phage terminase large subunit-like protein
VEIRDTILERNRQFGIAVVAYDPSQAGLMMQEVELEGIETHEVTFFGRSLAAMATTLTQAFRNRVIDLYRDPALESDLKKLRLKEIGFGYKLVAAEDESGHADRAIALSIVLPLAMEVAGAQPMETEETPAGPMVVTT